MADVRLKSNPPKKDLACWLSVWFRLQPSGFEDVRLKPNPQRERSQAAVLTVGPASAGRLGDVRL